MSIIDNLFNGWAKKNVPVGYEIRIVMTKSAQDTIMKCTIMGCFLPEQTHLH